MKKRLNLTLTLVLFVFIVMFLSSLLAGFISFIIQITGLFSFEQIADKSEIRSIRHFLQPIGLLGFCIILGTALTGFFSRKALNPIRKVIDATHKVAEGNFDVQVNLKGIGELEELSQSFNKMTHELSSIETLRRDFVNNFSHEFKTPIVSIRGFAKLVKEGNLSDEERLEYLNIIISESERLSELSTNILSLSKYETLEIIQDKKTFRLDEQIRRAVVLMEPKWSAKEMNVNVELEEIRYKGNEDLTQQIWLNLLDNAIKFCNPSGLINIQLISLNNGIHFSIQDDGQGMSEQTQYRIFDKFYQGDLSHSKGGNGLGLALVKRIVELCNGTIEVQSELGRGSTFSVFLPNEK